MQVSTSGTGKSSLLRVICHWGEKFLQQPGHNPDKPRVLICAPTGKFSN